jgi:hypothetical protein
LEEGLKKSPLVERLLKLQERRKKLEFKIRTEEMKRDLDPLSMEESDMLKSLRKRGIEDLKSRDER